MSGWEFVVAAVIGMVVGAAVVWWAQKAQLVSLRDRLADAENRARAAEKEAAEVKAQASATQVRAEQADRLREELESERAKVEDVKRETAAKEAEIAALDTKLREQESFFAQERQNHRAALEEQRKVLDDAQQALKDTFDRMSRNALDRNAESFLKLAEEKFKGLKSDSESELEKRKQAIEALVKPIAETLDKFDEKAGELEKERTRAFAQLQEQIRGVMHGNEKLHSETANLVKALRRPEQRGRWGEIQLENVIRLAGMMEYCDFELQRQVEVQDRKLRPDAIVRMPGGGSVVIDSKAPIDAYLSALESEDEAEKERLIGQFAVHFRRHIDQLSSKDYWEGFDSAGFVVMFVPGEAFFSAAFQKDPELLDYAFRKGVAVANPTSLIALLKAIAYGWQQVQLAENAEMIRDLARDLHARLKTFVDHMAKIDKALKAATKAYDDASSSLERRVLPQARRFEKLGVGVKASLPILNLQEALALPEAEVFAEAAEEVLDGKSAEDEP